MVAFEEIKHSSWVSWNYSQPPTSEVASTSKSNQWLSYLKPFKWKVAKSDQTCRVGQRLYVKLFWKLQTSFTIVINLALKIYKARIMKLVSIWTDKDSSGCCNASTLCVVCLINILYPYYTSIHTNEVLSACHSHKQNKKYITKHEKVSHFVVLKIKTATFMILSTLLERSWFQDLWCNTALKICIF